MENCCKAYLLRQLRELSQWSEQMENARQPITSMSATSGGIDRATQAPQELCNDDSI